MAIIIGLGNAGTQIVRLAAETQLLKNEKFYSIDSVASSTTMKNVSNVKSIPIISDSRSGSGRNRERGRAMFDFHTDDSDMQKMFDECAESESTVIAISSSAGGTGSGSIVGLCEQLALREVNVIPIIIVPAMEDPFAYHINTSDLFVELDGVGVATYSVFRNPHGTDYDAINRDVVRSIETILGYHYDPTDLDSIDDSDLDTIMSLSGRFISVYVEAPDVSTLKKELTRKILTGFQPGWTNEEAGATTLMAAFSLSSIFASTDFDDVFAEINERLGESYDIYKNIANIDENRAHATAIIAGLPTVKLKQLSGEFHQAGSIGDGLTKSVRPSFMSKKKAHIETADDKTANISGKKFRWK